MCTEEIQRLAGRVVQPKTIRDTKPTKARSKRSRKSQATRPTPGA